MPVIFLAEASGHRPGGNGEIYLRLAIRDAAAAGHTQRIEIQAIQRFCFPAAGGGHNLHMTQGVSGFKPQFSASVLLAGRPQAQRPLRFSADNFGQVQVKQWDIPAELTFG
ncbi:hypothetical protein D3C76_649950 [compost metagenome]